MGGKNVEARYKLGRILSATVRPARGPLDALVLTPLTPDEAHYFAEKHLPRLVEGGLICIAYPTDAVASPLASDDGRTAVAEGLNRLGFVPSGSFVLAEALVIAQFRAVSRSHKQSRPGLRT